MRYNWIPMDFDMKSVTVMVSELFYAVDENSLKENPYYLFAESCITADNGTVLQNSDRKTKALFDNPFDAVNSGISLQKKIDAYNMATSLDVPPILASIIIVTEDFYNAHNSIPAVMINESQDGDSRLLFGEIFISGDLFEILKHNPNFNFRIEQELDFPNNAQSLKFYKLLFDEHEIGTEKHFTLSPPVQQDMTKEKSRLRIIVTTIAVPALLVIIVTLISWYKNDASDLYKQHSIIHNAKKSSNTSNKLDSQKKSSLPTQTTQAR